MTTLVPGPAPRGGVLDRALDTALERALDGPDAPTLLVLSGPAGSGRTTALAARAAVLEERGTAVVALRVAPDGVVHRGPDGRGPAVPLRAVEGAAHDPAVATRAAATAAAPLLALDPVVVLVDDAQWMDHDTLAVLEALVRRLAGSPVRCVCAVRTPGAAPGRAAAVAALSRLRRDGLATTVRMRPLDEGRVADALRVAVSATPAPELVDRVRRSGRGVAAAVGDTIAGLQRRGAIRTVDRHAYLVAGRVGTGREDEPADDDHLLATVRRLGDGAFAAARASAVLAATGRALPALLAAALDTTTADADARLARLRAEGVLHRGRDRWRFLVPRTREALLAALGPFERRRLAALAVTAAWSGDAPDLDAGDRADLVADAGRLLPAARARAELLAAAGDALPAAPRRAARRWRAAADLAPDRAARADALFWHAVACFVGADHPAVVRGVREVLEDAAELSDEAVGELLVMLVCSLHNTGDVDGLADVAAGHDPWHRDDPARTVCRAIALCLLDRWDEARRLLARTRPVWSATRLTLALGELFEEVADLFAGHPARFERRLTSPGHGGREDAAHWRNHVNATVTALLVCGDARRAHEVLADTGLPDTALNLSDRATLALLGGREVEGMDLARRAVAGGGVRGYDAGRAAMSQTVALVMVGQGRLTSARELIAAARADRPTLAHLLENADAEVDRLLGDPDAARARLEAALRAAGERGLVVGTELVRAELGWLAHARGDVEGARTHLRALDGIAAATGGLRARTLSALARAVVEHDGEAAAEGLRLARGREHPWGLARAVLDLAGRGLADPSLLHEAYEIFGTFDALLCRAWTRNAMLAHDVVVPGRRQTKDENERLLGLLLAEGLTNKQLALVLQTSDKSVEGRLSRLFSRTGYRSRIELATALRDGVYPG